MAGLLAFGGRGSRGVTNDVWRLTTQRQPRASEAANSGEAPPQTTRPLPADAPAAGTPPPLEASWAEAGVEAVGTATAGVAASAVAAGSSQSAGGAPETATAGMATEVRGSPEGAVWEALTTHGAAPSERWGHSGAKLEQGRPRWLVFGGWVSASESIFANDLHALDLASFRWEVTRGP